MPLPPSAKYFATRKNSEIGATLVERLGEIDVDRALTARRGLIHDAYLYYYGFSPKGFHGTSGISRGGEQGELAEFRINHARALVNALKNLVTNQKIVWRPKAASFGADAVREVELAANILEYYWTEAQVSQYCDLAVENAIALTEGYVFTPWDEYAGEIVGDDPRRPGKLAFSGDVAFYNIPTWDVFRDPRKTSWKQLDWVIVRLPQNKYEVAARHEDDPKDAERKARGEPPLSEQVLASPESLDKVGTNTKETDSDDISVYYFYHRRGAVLPKGREVVFLANGTVLKDTTLEYDDVPLHRVTPAEFVGTPYGYSQFIEVMGIQELIDSLASAIATNQTTFAVQNIIATQGTQIPVDQLAGGLRVIYTPPGQPDAVRPLQLTSSPKEVFDFLETLKADQQRLFGLNDVVMGDAPSKDMSGAGMALLSQSALQQSSTLQANYIRLVQSIGSSILCTIRKRQQYPRTLDIVGKSNSFLVKPPEEYRGSDIGKISKVLVEIGNPMEQTPSGRFELGQQMIQLGAKLNIDQMQQLVTTGRMDPLTRRLQSELLNILSENEAIAVGQPPDAMLHDDHLLHGREHSVPVANPEARKNPKVLDAHMKHIHMHYELYFGVPAGEYQPPMPQPGMPPNPNAAPVFVPTDPLYQPRMLMLMGIQPPPPMVPPGAPMGPPGPGGPPSGPPPPEAAPPGPVMSGPQTAQLPSMPTNPATGQEWNPTDGGGAVQPPA